MSETTGLERNHQPTKLPKILIIEPHGNLIQLIKTHSRQDQYQLNHSHSGLLGVTAAQKIRPDIILCDVDIQQPNGYEVLKILQANNITRRIPVIMFGKDADDKIYRWAISHGAEDYLVMPIQNDDLINKIDAQLTRRKTSEIVTQELGVRVDYTLPHSFRTPLMMILGYSDLLTLDNETASPAFIREAATSIAVAGSRLERLTLNYLIYAQLKEIASSIKLREAFNRDRLSHTEDVIHVAAMNAVERHGRAKDIKLDLGESSVHASQESLTKIIDELVDNACKFSEPGNHIGIKSRRLNNHLYLFIADNGYGMSEDVINKLSGSLNTTASQGMGYTIVKLLVDLNQGELSIESEAERGTIITVKLPL